MSPRNIPLTIRDIPQENDGPFYYIIGNSLFGYTLHDPEGKVIGRFSMFPDHRTIQRRIKEIQGGPILNIGLKYHEIDPQQYK
jgi:hypothetical protein